MRLTGTPRHVALWLLTHGSDGRQEALESLRSIGIDAQGIRLLARCQAYLPSCFEQSTPYNPLGSLGL